MFQKQNKTKEDRNMARGIPRTKRLTPQQEFGSTQSAVRSLYGSAYPKLKSQNGPRPVSLTSKAFRRFLRKLTPERRANAIAVRQQLVAAPPKGKNKGNAADEFYDRMQRIL